MSIFKSTRVHRRECVDYENKQRIVQTSACIIYTRLLPFNNLNIVC